MLKLRIVVKKRDRSIQPTNIVKNLSRLDVIKRDQFNLIRRFKRRTSFSVKHKWVLLLQKPTKATKKLELIWGCSYSFHELDFQNFEHLHPTAKLLNIETTPVDKPRPNLMDITNKSPTCVLNFSQRKLIYNNNPYQCQTERNITKPCIK